LFEYSDLGTVALKGFAQNVAAWQVLGTGATESRFEARRATTTPLIGRDEEIDLLLRRLDQAKRGDGCVVLISGEPGIGKSRIAQTIVERLSGEPHIRLRCFCSPHHPRAASRLFFAARGCCGGLTGSAVTMPDGGACRAQIVVTSAAQMAANSAGQIAATVATLAVISKISNRRPKLGQYRSGQARSAASA
jgi:hypothetical protein